MTQPRSHGQALRRALTLALALLAPVPAAAAPASPLRARLRVAPQALATRHAPPAPNATSGRAPEPIEVGQQARAALVPALLRLFEPAGAGAADLEVELLEVKAAHEWDVNALRVRMELAVAVRAADGTELARLAPTGEALAANESSGAVAVAFSRAATAAASTFEHELVRRPAVAALLVQRGVEPAAIVPAPLPAPLPPPASARPRAPSVAYLALGAALTGDTGVGLAGRVGVAGPVLLLQASLQRWTTAARTLRAPGLVGTVEPSVTTLGLEVGAEARLAGGWSLRGGLGPQAVMGSTAAEGLPEPTPARASRVALGGFAGVDYGRIVGANGLGLRVGLELRGLWGAELSFAGLPAYDVGGWGVALLVAAELPWRWALTPAARD